ncbi:MAG: hypothetical protein ACAH59_06810 [Pseudobdellovibrionaceae bacterium]
MSHFDTLLRQLVSLTTAGFFALAPSIASASIPAAYFPKYKFKLAHSDSGTVQEIPVGQSFLSLTAANTKSRRPASINRAAQTVAAPSKIFYGENGTSISPELIANYNHVKASEKPIDISSIIPLDMKPTHDSAAVFSQVADQSLTTLFNSPELRESSIGQTATAVEQKMKQEVVIGSEDPESTQHKLNFNVQAFQATAQVQYTGLTNAALKYKIAKNELAMEVFEKVASNQDVVLSHSISSADRVSEVSFRWSF